jgi:glycosyltransferase involved in cell wall biosynthesis
MFVAPSRFYASGMLGRMKMPEDSLRVIGPGIDLSDYPADPAVVRSYAGVQPPVLGFFARMSPEKGLDKLVEAYIALRQSGLQPNLKLVIGGSYSPADASFVRRLQKQLGAFGLLGDVEFRPNVDRNTKIRLLQSMTVFSVPVRYREAFGMYLLEAMAAGVPVVQPPTNAFPEIIEDTGGGVICESDDTPSLAKTIQQVLEDADLRRKLAANGHRAVREKYDVNVIARCYIEAFG